MRLMRGAIYASEDNEPVEASCAIGVLAGDDLYARPSSSLAYDVTLCGEMSLYEIFFLHRYASQLAMSVRGAERLYD